MRTSRLGNELSDQPAAIRGGEIGAGETPWLTVREAAARAKCGVKTVYREVRAGRLRAARIGGRRELRLRPEWIDEWLDRTSMVVIVGGEQH